MKPLQLQSIDCVEIPLLAEQQKGSEQHSSRTMFSQKNMDTNHFMDPSGKNLGTPLPHVQPPPRIVHCLIDEAIPLIDQPTILADSS